MLSDRHQALADAHYDFYKAVHGIRPRWMIYENMTEADLESELNTLQKESDIQDAQDKIMHEKNANDAMIVIQNLMAAGAKDTAMAIRWLHEAHNTNGDNQYLDYCLGCEYGFIESLI